LALAFVRDTVSAAAGAAGVAGVVVVSDDPLVREETTLLGATVIADEPRAGHNAAVLHGVRWARAQHPDAGVAAVSGDLPALTSVDLGTALAEAARYGAAFVADRERAGTTLLAAAPGNPFAPAFGPGSADAHRAAGFVELTDARPSLRRDVDTAAHLAEARDLGLGPATAQLLSRLDTAAVRGA
jgi:2-phospho-L-lactate guanylyltransferase